MPTDKILIATHVEAHYKALYKESPTEESAIETLFKIVAPQLRKADTKAFSLREAPISKQEVAHSLKQTPREKPADL